MNIFNSFSTILQIKPDPFNRYNSISKYFNLDVCGGFVNVLNSIGAYSETAYGLNTNCDFSNNITPTTYLIYKNKTNNRVLRTTDFAASSNNSFTIYLKHACRFSSNPVLGHNFVTDLIPLGGNTVPLNYYTVTVMNNVFWISISGQPVSNPVINFSVGNVYAFDQSDPSNAENTLVFGNVPDSSMNYTTAVIINGTAGNPGSYTLINYTTYNVFLYYYSNNLSGMGAACGTQVALTATVTSQTLTYTGTPFTFTLITNINGTYSGSPSITQTNIGTYTTTVTGTGRYYGSVTASLVIQPIPLTATVNSQTVYNTGSPITKTLISGIVGTYSGSPSITQTVPGVYTTTITATGLYTGSYTATLTILKIPLIATVNSQTFYNFTGSSISATVITDISGTYSGSPSITQTVAGVYTTTITATGLYTGSYTGTLTIVSSLQIPVSQDGVGYYFTNNPYTYMQNKTIFMKFKGINNGYLISAYDNTNDNRRFYMQIAYETPLQGSGQAAYFLKIYYGFGKSFITSNRYERPYYVRLDNFDLTQYYNLFFYFTNINTNDGQFYPRLYVYNSNGSIISNSWVDSDYLLVNNNNPEINLNIFGESGRTISNLQTVNNVITSGLSIWRSFGGGYYYGTYTFTGLLNDKYYILDRDIFDDYSGSYYSNLNKLVYYPGVLTSNEMSFQSQNP